jgi:hypothetical protein
MSYGLAEYNPQMESFEYDFEAYESESGVFNESEEMELAAELLEVRDEAELEQFLGDLIKKAGNAIGKVVKSPIGQAIGGVLKAAAKKALPIAGAALGGMVGGPLGAQLGGGLANMAGSALGLELEGLTSEDREFEAAKQFVRFAGDTVKNAVAQPQANPVAAASTGAQQAAQVHAPGLLGAGPSQGASSGRWERRGGNIIVIGV